MMFIATPTKIPEVLTITLNPFIDHRGFFCETYRAEDFQKLGMPLFKQENHSKSIKGTLRGLHFQKSPCEIGKLVRCVRGSIFDVAVDIRKNSPTFGKYISIYLSENVLEWLYIPLGFAHGFYVVSETAEIIYKTTGYYSKEHDSCIKWNDPQINIQWPAGEKILSEKDTNAPLLMDI